MIICEYVDPYGPSLIIHCTGRGQIFALACPSCAPRHYILCTFFHRSVAEITGKLDLRNKFALV